MQLYRNMTQTFALVRSLFDEANIVEFQSIQSAKWIILSIYIAGNEVGAENTMSLLQLA